MIYRIIGEAERWAPAEGDEDAWIRVRGPLCGGWTAGLAWFAWDDLTAPSVTNPRLRFWFTEAGWQRYRSALIAGARASGRPYRVIRRKNPRRSAVAYRDKWQVALLPESRVFH